MNAEKEKPALAAPASENEKPDTGIIVPSAPRVKGKAVRRGI